jgi:hypothetical protein
MAKYQIFAQNSDKAGDALGNAEADETQPQSLRLG